jgi:hypothetical protein
MTNGIGSVKQIVESDYQSLCRVIGIKPVPLDVYEFSANSEERTPLGTPLKNATPLYDSRIVVIPVVPEMVEEYAAAPAKFPPNSWDKFSKAWPQWRIELWHEVLHQIEHHVLNAWKDGEHHGESYKHAIEIAANKLSSIADVTPEKLRKIALGA